MAGRACSRSHGWLVGPRICAFSVIAPTLWSISDQMAPILLIFQNNQVLGPECCEGSHLLTLLVIVDCDNYTIYFLTFILILFAAQSHWWSWAAILNE